MTILLLVIAALSTSGCMSDQTKRMAATCQDMLGRNDREGARAFIRDAQEQLLSLEKHPNRVMALVRDLQDPDAMAYKPALEQCLWLLKSRQS